MKKIVKLELFNTVPFKNHHFKIEIDESFKELLESIKDILKSILLKL